MPRYTTRVPRYRLHKPSGQAVVTLNGRDIYLGEHGSAESKAEYNRLVAEWQLNGRALPPSANPSSDRVIDEVIAAYLTHAERYYIKNGTPTSTLCRIRRVLHLLHNGYGHVNCSEFGPLALKTVRDTMGVDRDWCRSTVNEAAAIMKRMFKWAAENELVPAEVFHRLQTVSGLRRGRTELRDSQPVTPAPIEPVEAVIKCVAAPVAAMIQLQIFTGMRPDEVIQMRACDIDLSDDAWVYTPASHKTEHHGRQRRIYLGPKSQRVLLPYLNTDPARYLFSPVEAERQRRARQHAQRRTPPGYGNFPGSNRKQNPAWMPGSRYTTNSYRRAIHRACDHAFPPPDHLARVKVSGEKGVRWETIAEWRKRLGEKKWQELEAWRRAHRWSPNQLRHNAATELRKQFGIEAARVVLGHSSAVVTEIYAEMDFDKAKSIMSRVG